MSQKVAEWVYTGECTAESNLKSQNYEIEPCDIPNERAHWEDGK